MDVAVFCYNRPDKLRMCLDMVDLSYVDKLWVFCDTWKNKQDEEMVLKTIDIARKFRFQNKEVVVREKNFGTPKNVINGLDRVFKSSDTCMVLEDDCIVRPEAYAYVDKALKIFENDRRVFSINTMAPLGLILNKIASLFVHNDIVACRRVFAFWGWATWASRWGEFRSDLEPFKNPYGNAQKVPLGVGRHVRATLKLHEEGRVGGWDARLLCLAYYNKCLHIHPRVSLMRNIGLDGTGPIIRHASRAYMMSKH